MKKYLLLFIAFAGLTVTSCDTDDSKKEEVKPVVVTESADWEPTTIQLIKIVPLQTIPYPHTENCNKDYLKISKDNKAVFFRYEGAECAVTEYADAFKRDGKNVTLNVLGYQISGVIEVETTSTMEIKSDISAYVPLIKAQFPQYEQYLSLVEGGTVKLTFNKK